MKAKITYIIPLHIKDKRVFRALASTPKDANIIVSAPSDVQAWLMSAENTQEVKTLFMEDEVFIMTGEDAKASTYPALVNAGIKKALELGTDWISILEFDDELQSSVKELLHKYIVAYDDADILAPLACIVRPSADEDDIPTLVGMANEAAFANGISEEFGYYDLSTMLKNNFVFMNGCFIKSDVFTEVGMFKENFTILFDYEWILRAVYQGKVIRAVPRATHFHYLNPDGAFEAAKALMRTDGELWLKRVKTEYFYEEDRPFTN